jgi:hypothetical protein
MGDYPESARAAPASESTQGLAQCGGVAKGGRAGKTKRALRRPQYARTSRLRAVTSLTYHKAPIRNENRRSRKTLAPPFAILWLRHTRERISCKVR